MASGVLSNMAWGRTGRYPASAGRLVPRKAESDVEDVSVDLRPGSESIRVEFATGCREVRRERCQREVVPHSDVVSGSDLISEPRRVVGQRPETRDFDIDPHGARTDSGRQEKSIGRLRVPLRDEVHRRDGQRRRPTLLVVLLRPTVDLAGENEILTNGSSDPEITRRRRLSIAVTPFARRAGASAA